MFLRLAREGADSPRLGVLCNPLSGRVRREASSIAQLRSDVGSEAFQEASSPEDIAASLEKLSLGAEDALAVVGGDGTLQAVLTALHRTTPQDPWPALVPIAGGSTNMTALDLGARGRLAPALASLRGAQSNSADLERVQRPLLMLEQSGAAPLCGMFFGTGAIAEGVQFFRRRLRGVGMPSERTSVFSVGRVLLSIAMRRTKPCVMSGSIDGHEFDRSLTFGFVSTLHRLLLGTRPYWGAEDAPLHTTLVDSAARGIVRNIRRLGSGRPGRHLTPERGYVSHNAHRLEFKFDGPFVLDGELFESSAAQGPLVLTSPRMVEWWVPS